jgi:CheY-like chemotaxis protein
MAVPVQVVIIDDNAGSVEMLSAALRQTGVSLHMACDPVQGFELVRRLRPLAS